MMHKATKPMKPGKVRRQPHFFNNEEDEPENAEEWDSYDDYMKDAFDFNDDQEDSLVDHFDSDFLDEVPIGERDDVDDLDFNGIQSNQMYRGDQPVYGQGRRSRRGGPSQPVQTQDPW